MAIQFIRIGELANSSKGQGRIPVAPVTIWRWVQQNRFPAPFRLGDHTTVWDVAEVEAWLQQQTETRFRTNPDKSRGGGRRKAGAA